MMRGVGLLQKYENQAAFLVRKSADVTRSLAIDGFPSCINSVSITQLSVSLSFALNQFHG